MRFHIIEILSYNDHPTTTGKVLISTDIDQPDSSFAVDVALGLAKKALQDRLTDDPMVVNNEGELAEAEHLLRYAYNYDGLHRINGFLGRGNFGKTLHVVRTGD